MADQDQKKQDMLTSIASSGYKFPHIILYNSINSGNGVQEGMDTMISFHERLLGFHAFMAGFEFLGLSFGVDSTDNLGTISKGFLTIGFLLSGIGSVVSFIAAEYFNGVKNESDEMIVVGFLKYWRFFYLSDLCGFGSTVAFMVAVNVLIHIHLPAWAAFSLNGFTGAAGIVLFIFFKMIILDRQTYGGGRRIFVHPLPEDKPMQDNHNTP
jgi:hypothetical protein